MNKICSKCKKQFSLLNKIYPKLTAVGRLFNFLYIKLKWNIRFSKKLKNLLVFVSKGQ